ncbi:MAG: hypothetical protein GVY29_13670 [Spirochaetes bacterium]|nr:hypothetical protein [Spirochaetota bacterium]
MDLISDFGATRQRLDLRSAETEGSHFGADRNYIRALDAFCRGDAPTVGASEGLQAARMVEAAHRSIGNGGACIDMNGIEGG